MKRTDLISQNNGRENPTFCPVGCPVCRYDGGLYPARFHSVELPGNADLLGMERKANHIVFLLEGTLHIHIEGNEHHYLNSGQCMFLPRTQYPDIRAIAPSRVVWLDFSNRIVLGGQDALASTVLSGIHPAEGIPILSVTPQIERLLTEVQALEIPCYHMLKQYELFFLMKAFYADGELGCFFNAVLRPIHDFRAFVESNYANDDTLEDIARKTNLEQELFHQAIQGVFRDQRAPMAGETKGGATQKDARGRKVRYRRDGPAAGPQKSEGIIPVLPPAFPLFDDRVEGAANRHRYNG